MSMSGAVLRGRTGSGRPRTRRSQSTRWRGVRAGRAGPHRGRTVGSGVVDEAHLAGPAVRRVTELRQCLVGAAVVLVELVDLAGFLAGRHAAAELGRDPDQLLHGG